MEQKVKVSYEQVIRSKVIYQMAKPFFFCGMFQ